jgi:hypothetical protein
MANRSFDEDTSWSRSGKSKFGTHTTYYSRAVIVENGKKCGFCAYGNTVLEANELLNSFLSDKCNCWTPKTKEICPVHRKDND